MADRAAVRGSVTVATLVQRPGAFAFRPLEEQVGHPGVDEVELVLLVATFSQHAQV